MLHRSSARRRKTGVLHMLTSWFKTGISALLLLAAAMTPASAQDWPTKPIRLIVTFAPGSTPDILARLLSERLSARLGKPVLVENRQGAGGNIGTDAVAKATPDGYTFGITISGPLAANTLLYKNLPYQPLRDLEFVSIAATQASVLVVPAQSGITDVATLLRRMRSEPARFNYASMGNGSISHLAMEALAARSASDPVHVPYASSVQAVTSLLASDTQLAVLPAGAVMPQVKAGKLKAIAVATARRSSLMPDLPTLTESGLPDVFGDAWIGVIAPAKTPAAVVRKLQAEIAQIMHADDMRARLTAQYMEAVGGSSAEFRATLQSDLDRWRPIIRKNNISLD